jgi:hypothetical protein
MKFLINPCQRFFQILARILKSIDEIACACLIIRGTKIAMNPEPIIIIISRVRTALNSLGILSLRIRICQKNLTSGAPINDTIAAISTQIII